MRKKLVEILTLSTAAPPALTFALPEVPVAVVNPMDRSVPPVPIELLRTFVSNNAGIAAGSTIERECIVLLKISISIPVVNPVHMVSVCVVEGVVGSNTQNLSG